MTKLILTGGFLGSGKTTLLKQVARRMSERRRSVGTIVNDQAPGLADTAILSGCSCGVKEVAGSCFCCDFHAFEAAVQSLIDRGADIILAEPVGSCTDLAATILQPLKDRRPDIDVAPFTVLVSPDHVREALGESESELHPNALYILRLQMAESDRLLLNKIDLLDATERAALTVLLREAFPNRPIGELSAATGEGIDAWMADVLAGGEAGSHVVDVDYDRYAEGEAVLGWLNAVIHLEAVEADADFLRPAIALITALHGSLRESRTEVGHVKIVVTAGEEQRTANLTNVDGAVIVPDQSALHGGRGTLILNARVQAAAEFLEAIVREAMSRLSGPSVRALTTEFRCLTPGRPQPTYRYPTAGTRGGADRPQ
ncbi:MAG TPA: GTP-binding protein [Verrucomicrobiae bacterium]|nr:GTP-binding protein [Verrucomicrobiae bacterium]